MKLRSTIFALAVLGLSTASLNATAAFWSREKPQQPEKVGLISIGEVDQQIANQPAGFSSGVNLPAAMVMLLPEGWTSKIGITARKVVWESTTDWVEALGQIAEQTGSSVVVDWSKKSVSISAVLVAPILAATVPPAPYAASIAPDSLFVLPPPPVASNTSDSNIASASVGSGLGDSGVKPSDSASAADAKPEPIYPDLASFLREEIQVDQTNVSLIDGLAAILPKGWSVDIRSTDDAVWNIRMDMTHVGSRGAALNAIGIKEHLTLIPFTNFKKLIVTREQ